MENLLTRQEAVQFYAISSWLIIRAWTFTCFVFNCSIVYTYRLKLCMQIDFNVGDSNCRWNDLDVCESTEVVSRNDLGVCKWTCTRNDQHPNWYDTSFYNHKLGYGWTKEQRTVDDEASKAGYTWWQLEKIAQNRPRWRAMVSVDLCSTGSKRV